MFFFCKPKPLIVHFFTAREEVFLHAKPQKAAQYIPEWVKQLPKAQFPEDISAPLKKKLNIKSCPGLINLYKKGFVLPLWSDLSVEIIDGSWRYQFADNVSVASPHVVSQFDGAPFSQDYTHLKLHNPWAFSSNLGVDVLFTAPSWNGFGYGDVVVAPGAYSPHNISSAANINLFFRKQKERVVYELPFGHPLVHIVPVTERNLVLKYELVSEAEVNRRHLATGLTLFGANRYYRVDKLCPHA